MLKPWLFETLKLLSIIGQYHHYNKNIEIKIARKRSVHSIASSRIFLNVITAHHFSFESQRLARSIQNPRTMVSVCSNPCETKAYLQKHYPHLEEVVISGLLVQFGDLS